MKFEAIERETVILDPNNDMQRKSIRDPQRPSHRKDFAHLPFYALKMGKAGF
jgi:hypothetical protein